MVSIHSQGSSSEVPSTLRFQGASQKRSLASVSSSPSRPTGQMKWESIHASSALRWAAYFAAASAMGRPAGGKRPA